jgi:uncharacterized protein YjbI with pentapeptide repeats
MTWAWKAKAREKKFRAVPFEALPEPSKPDDDAAAFNKKSDDLDALQKSVSDAATVGAPLWLSYIFLMFYVAIAAGAVQHKDLLLENPVELPFLSIKLPLKAFFVLAPILFLIVHAYVLAHFAMLADKAKVFHEKLKAKICSHDSREGLRRQLPINVFVQFLAGPSNIREGLFSLLLWAVAWVTLVGGPVATLLLLQAQFLPYHDSRVTWVHRGALIADTLLIWPLWMWILSARENGSAPATGLMSLWSGFLAGVRKYVAVPLTIMIWIFTVLVATYPGEWKEWPYSLVSDLAGGEATACAPKRGAESKSRSGLCSLQELSRAVAGESITLSEWVTERTFGKVDPFNPDAQQLIKGSWPVNSLRLQEFDIYDALKLEPDKLKWKDNNFSLKNRHLEQGDFRSARLGNIDLREANLNGAWLRSASLEGANLDEARLQGASLYEAKLEGASLQRADLRGASLNFARLEGANLDDAHLEGASLYEARLQGASLSSTHLQGALADDVKLSLAWLLTTDLRGASLSSADLRGAWLSDTQLQGASLSSANLWATELDKPRLWRVDFERAFGGREGLTGGSTAIWLPVAIDWVAVQGWVVGAEQEPGKTEPILELTEIPWDEGRYLALRQEIEGLPRGTRRQDALKRIERLDCERVGDGVVSCDPQAPMPKIVMDWRSNLERGGAKEADRAKELALVLRQVLCADEDVDAIYVLRSVIKNGTLEFAASGAPQLLEDISSPACVASKAMTDEEKRQLDAIKRTITDRQKGRPKKPYSNQAKPNLAGRSSLHPKGGDTEPSLGGDPHEPKL